MKFIKVLSAFTLASSLLATANPTLATTTSPSTTQASPTDTTGEDAVPSAADDNKDGAKVVGMNSDTAAKLKKDLVSTLGQYKKFNSGQGASNSTEKVEPETDSQTQTGAPPTTTDVEEGVEGFTSYEAVDKYKENTDIYVTQFLTNMRLYELLFENGINLETPALARYELESTDKLHFIIAGFSTVNNFSIRNSQLLESSADADSDQEKWEDLALAVSSNSASMTKYFSFSTQSTSNISLEEVKTEVKKQINANLSNSIYSYLTYLNGGNGPDDVRNMKDKKRIEEVKKILTLLDQWSTLPDINKATDAMIPQQIAIVNKPWTDALKDVIESMNADTGGTEEGAEAAAVGNTSPTLAKSVLGRLGSSLFSVTRSANADDYPDKPLTNSLGWVVESKNKQTSDEYDPGPAAKDMYLAMFAATSVYRPMVSRIGDHDYVEAYKALFGEGVEPLRDDDERLRFKESPLGPLDILNQVQNLKKPLYHYKSFDNLGTATVYGNTTHDVKGVTHLLTLGDLLNAISKKKEIAAVTVHGVLAQDGDVWNFYNYSLNPNSDTPAVGEPSAPTEEGSDNGESIEGGVLPTGAGDAFDQGEEVSEESGDTTSFLRNLIPSLLSIPKAHATTTTPIVPEEDDSSTSVGAGVNNACVSNTSPAVEGLAGETTDEQGEEVGSTGDTSSNDSDVECTPAPLTPTAPVETTTAPTTQTMGPGPTVGEPVLNKVPASKSINASSESTRVVFQMTFNDKNPGVAYMTGAIMHNIYKETLMKSTLADRLNEAVYIDVVGNIVLNDGLVILPAAANPAYWAMPTKQTDSEGAESNLEESILDGDNAEEAETQGDVSNTDETGEPTTPSQGRADDTTSFNLFGNKVSTNTDTEEVDSNLNSNGVEENSDAWVSQKWIYNPYTVAFMDSYPAIYQAGTSPANVNEKKDKDKYIMSYPHSGSDSIVLSPMKEVYNTAFIISESAKLWKTFRVDGNSESVDLTNELKGDLEYSDGSEAANKRFYNLTSAKPVQMFNYVNEGANIFPYLPSQITDKTAQEAFDSQSVDYSSAIYIAKNMYAYLLGEVEDSTGEAVTPADGRSDGGSNKSQFREGFMFLNVAMPVLTGVTHVTEYDKTNAKSDLLANGADSNLIEKWFLKAVYFLANIGDKVVGVFSDKFADLATIKAWFYSMIVQYGFHLLFLTAIFVIFMFLRTGDFMRAAIQGGIILVIIYATLFITPTVIPLVQAIVAQNISESSIRANLVAKLEDNEAVNVAMEAGQSGTSVKLYNMTPKQASDMGQMFNREPNEYLSTQYAINNNLGIYVKDFELRLDLYSFWRFDPLIVATQENVNNPNDTLENVPQIYHANHSKSTLMTDNETAKKEMALNNEVLDYYMPYNMIQDGLIETLNKYLVYYKPPRSLLRYPDGLVRSSYIFNTYTKSLAFLAAEPEVGELITTAESPDNYSHLGISELEVDVVNQKFYPFGDILNLQSWVDNEWGEFPDVYKSSLWGDTLFEAGFYDIEDGAQKRLELANRVNREAYEVMLHLKDTQGMVSDETLIKIVALYATMEFNKEVGYLTKELYPLNPAVEELTVKDLFEAILLTDNPDFQFYDVDIVANAYHEGGVVRLIALVANIIILTAYTVLTSLILPILTIAIAITMAIGIMVNEPVRKLLWTLSGAYITILAGSFVFNLLVSWLGKSDALWWMLLAISTLTTIIAFVTFTIFRIVLFKFLTGLALLIPILSAFIYLLLSLLRKIFGKEESETFGNFQETEGVTNNAAFIQNNASYQGDTYNSVRETDGVIAPIDITIDNQSPVTRRQAHERNNSE